MADQNMTEENQAAWLEQLVSNIPATADDMVGAAFVAEEKIREFDPVDLPVKNHFSKGVYAREMFIPKGTVLTGHIHKYENLNIMSQGELSIFTENGVIRVKAPYTVVSPPGTKRLAYAHEDTIWTTIHGTEETDVDKIEAQFIAHSHADYLAFRQALELEEN